MCATVFYTKLIKGKLYPRAARTGTYANEVSRVRGKVVSTYLGIVKVPESAVVAENVVAADVVEKGREADAGKPSESQ